MRLDRGVYNGLDGALARIEASVVSPGRVGLGCVVGRTEGSVIRVLGNDTDVLFGAIGVGAIGMPGPVITNLLTW